MVFFFIALLIPSVSLRSSVFHITSTGNVVIVNINVVPIQNLFPILHSSSQHHLIDFRTIVHASLKSVPL